jgi:hypothetical protein
MSPKTTFVDVMIWRAVRARVHSAYNTNPLITVWRLFCKRIATGTAWDAAKNWKFVQFASVSDGFHIGDKSIKLPRSRTERPVLLIVTIQVCLLPMPRASGRQTNFANQAPNAKANVNPYKRWAQFRFCKCNLVLWMTAQTEWFGANGQYTHLRRFFCLLLRHDQLKSQPMNGLSL